MSNIEIWSVDADWMMTALAWLMTYALHSTVLLGGAWLLFKIASGTPERIRDGLWKLAMIGGVVTATTQVGMGVKPFGGRLFLLTSEEQVVPDQEQIVAPTTALPPIEVVGPNEFVPAPETKLRESLTPRQSTPELKSSGQTKRDSFPSHLVENDVQRSPRWINDRRVPKPTGIKRKPARIRGLDESTEATGSSPEPKRLVAPPATVSEPNRFDFVSSPNDSSLASVRSAAKSAKDSNPTEAEVTASPWLLLPWLVGIVLAGSVVTIALIQLKKALSRRRPLVEGPVAELFANLLRRSGVKRPIRLSISSELDAPITFGVWFAEISIPERALTELDSEQQEAMLAHEIAHLNGGVGSWGGSVKFGRRARGWSGPGTLVTMVSGHLGNTLP
ncbi:MAG: hypothetical protein ACI8TQ_001938 [Planctomycetota bacterium]|jgi:hypothetical protein